VLRWSLLSEERVIWGGSHDFISVCRHRSRPHSYGTGTHPGRPLATELARSGEGNAWGTVCRRSELAIIDPEALLNRLSGQATALGRAVRVSAASSQVPFGTRHRRRRPLATQLTCSGEGSAWGTVCRRPELASIDPEALLNRLSGQTTALGGAVRVPAASSQVPFGTRHRRRRPLATH
jgi:hypothetical protein